MFLPSIWYFWAVSTLIQTEGIVIKTMKYGETSIITHVLTRQHGLQTLIMGGVNAGHNKSGMFQIMNQLELVLYYNEHKPMHRIKEVRYSRIYQALPFEMSRTAVGVFMLELLRKCIQGNDFDCDLYDWIKACLDHSDDASLPVTWMPLHFILGLTRHLGFQPLDNHDEGRPFFDLREGRFIEAQPYHKDYLESEPSCLLHQIIASGDLVHISTFSCPRQVRKELMYGLLDYYRFHLDHFNGLDSPLILEEILTA
jgi:DNA repair protein RecO (recombination protein O)